MVKAGLSCSIETDILNQVADYNKNTYPGLSQSAVVEILLRDALSRVVLSQAGSEFLEVDVGGEKKISSLDVEV